MIERSKLPNQQTTIFTVMSKMAADHGALNLSQGFPNFPSDPVLLEAVAKAMRDGYNQYAPMQGDLGLRERIVEKTQSLYGKRYDVASEVTVTAGATQAIFTAIAATICQRDEVIIFTRRMIVTNLPSVFLAEFPSPYNSVPLCFDLIGTKWPRALLLKPK